MYKIYTEGREINEVIKVNRTVRIDISTYQRLRDIPELSNFEYETKKGHEQNGMRVFYITIVSENIQPKPINIKNKRYVIKNANELGIESGEYNEATDNWMPTWYIWDKVNKDILQGEMYEGYGGRTAAKKRADHYNRII